MKVSAGEDAGGESEQRKVSAKPAAEKEQAGDLFQPGCVFSLHDAKPAAEKEQAGATQSRDAPMGGSGPPATELSRTCRACGAKSTWDCDLHEGRYNDKCPDCAAWIRDRMDADGELERQKAGAGPAAEKTQSGGALPRGRPSAPEKGRSPGRSFFGLALSKGRPPAEPRSSMWFLLPVFMTVFGGLVAYFILRHDDPQKAKNCLYLGVALAAAFAVMGMILSWINTPV